MSPPRSRRDSRQETEPRRPKSRQEFSPSSHWDSGREAKSRRPKSQRDPGSKPAKIPPGFTAGSENSAAKISAGDPASTLSAKRNPGGQNLRGIPPGFTVGNGNPGNPGGQNRGRTRWESRWGPTGIHGGERKSRRPKSRQDPAGIPVGSRQDPGGFFTRVCSEMVKTGIG